MQAEMHKVGVPYEIDGVQVHANPKTNLDAYRWADVIISHLDYTKHAMNLAHVLDKPFIHIVHNSYPYESIISSVRVDGVIYNSHWIADFLNYEWPSFVFQPPTPTAYYNVNENPEQNEYITLISLNENKGGEIFYRIAKAMPHKHFLGVTGSYDSQIKKDCPNVEIIANTSEIRDVYKKTRILLMISRYESWGMTATEAMCNGIPVICTPTEGLKENCKDAALYVDPRCDLIKDDAQRILKDDRDSYDISSIIKQINKLDNKDFYKKVSIKSRNRAKELDPATRLLELEKFIINCSTKKANKPRTMVRYL
jgi:glycosyltransferase involved in cell wall biosynthesis